MSPDFVDLLSEFTAHEVDAIVVGAHALAAHGHVRATKDLDVWVRPSRENATRVMRALASFGAPLGGVSEADFATSGIVFQIGVEPVRIDLLTQIDGVTFDEAWSERVPASLGGVQTFVLSRKLLIQNKRASGRLQDLADVERLETPDDDDS